VREIMNMNTSMDIGMTVNTDSNMGKNISNGRGIVVLWGRDEGRR
jgi:hypothetical protein